MDKENIVFYGDSITNAAKAVYEGALGMGYVINVAGYLGLKYPNRFNFINEGIDGNMVVDLYARVKRDLWRHKPNYVVILVGVNDVLADIGWYNGVDKERFERVYNMLIEDSIKNCPNVKFLLVEPYYFGEKELNEELVLRAKIVEKIARERNIPFVKIREKLESAIKESGKEKVLVDNVHPAPYGAMIIADEVSRAMEENYIKEKIKC